MTSAETTVASVTDGRSRPLPRAASRQARQRGRRGSRRRPLRSRGGQRARRSRAAPPAMSESGIAPRLDALRPGAEVPDPAASAGWAALDRSGGSPTVMAAKRTPGEVIDERKVEVRAAQALATIAAEDEGRRSAAIDDEDGLLVSTPKSRERVGQLGRESTDSRRPARLEVHDSDRRDPTHPAVDEPRALGMPAADAGQRHQVGRCRSQHQTRADDAQRRRGTAARASSGAGCPTLDPPSCSILECHDQWTAPSGAKAAVRVPTTTRALPRRLRHHSSCCSPPRGR